MGPSVQGAKPNTYERPVTPASVSRSISTSAAVGMRAARADRRALERHQHGTRAGGLRIRGNVAIDASI